MTLVLNGEEVVRALTLEDHIDAMEEAFTEMGKGAAVPANARRLGLGTEIPTDWFLQKEHT
ncbi:MAG TPA: hypothetical protein VGL70_19830 [Candidatus Binatia bacterium]|jgi:hypothetical protein